MAINSLSAASYGLSGMVSGMNTQEMVEKMLSGTKNKITSTQQKRAQLEYKQQIYRDVATQMRTLQNNFFSFANPSTNLLSSAFYSKMTAKTESKYFTATATTSAREGTARVDYITQLAKAASLSSSGKASAPLSTKHVNNSGDVLTNRTDISDFVDNKMLNSIKRGKLEFTVTGTAGERKVTIDTSSNVWQQIAGKSGDEAAQAFNDALAKSLPDAANPGTFLDPGIRAEFSNGKLNFKATGNNESMALVMNSEAQALLGFASGAVTGAGGVSAAIDTRKLLPSIRVTMDNQEAKTIYLDVEKARAAGGDGVDMLVASLKDGLDKAFGTNVISVSSDADGKITFGVNDGSRSFKFEGSEEVMSMVGLKTGQSNKMTSGMFLDQINFAKQLQGNEFKFSINDVSFSVTANTTLTSLMSQINNSAAGVKVSYNENTDKFLMESTVSGKGGSIDIKQQQGNLMEAMFGVKGNTSVTGKTLLKSGSEKSLKTEQPTVFKSRGGTVSFDIVQKDGTRRNISIPVNPPAEADVYFTDKTAFVTAVNKALAEKEDTKNLGIKFEVGTDGNVTLTSDEDVQFIANAGSGSVMAQLGFTNGQTNGATSSNMLSEVFGGSASDPFTMQVNGTTVMVNRNMTIDQLQDHLNTSLTGEGLKFEWNESNARFDVINTGAASRTVTFGGDAEKLFGSQAVFEAQTSPTVTAGQDAILSINGNRLERSSNNFTYEGITYNVTQTFDGREKEGQFYKLADYPDRYVDADGYFVNQAGDKLKADGSVATNPADYAKIDGSETYRYTERAGQVDTTRDTEQIYNGIVKFVEDYNKTIETLHSLLIEEPDYKDYLPLTDEQKSAMSDKEIEMWEEKSKTGLLRSDSTLNKIWDDLRSTMYKKPSGSDLAIYNIGITTSSTSEYGGQLTIDHSKLLEMIKSDPEGIKNMFSNTTDGVATALNEAINRAAKISTTSPGSLVSVAGSGKSDTTSSLYRQMKELDKNLETLGNRYDAEYSRYWKQFNAMEQMIQQMNSQSSWLSQQFA